MSKLAPDLFDRRFENLLEIGRARLPGLAPGWTDHNLHDPGITLMELLAWVAEAQIYSLARTRRDERDAYAALFGLSTSGPGAASGIIWPDTGPAAVRRALARVVAQGTLVHTEQAATPAYRTVYRQLLAAAHLRAVRTVTADGCQLDHSATNERASVVFLPFGEHAGARDVLALDIECTGEAGLFPVRRKDADHAWLSVGVRADAAPTACAAAIAPGAGLEVTLVADAERHPVPVAADSTSGFMRTGALMLDLSAIPGSPRAFTLEFRALRGFARPPRATRIGLNVLPIRQGRVVERELHVASGLPDQELLLQEAGLEFGAGADAVRVEVVEAGEIRRWTQVARLADSGPAMRAYQLDPARAIVRFGNGVNGGLPAPGAQVMLSYAVCDGSAGNAAPNRRWVVHGVDGAYGSNPDHIAGGTGARDRSALRRTARHDAGQVQSLVTAGDFETAALALDGLEVVRAATLAQARCGGNPGQVILLAMRARPAGIEPREAPETARWLAAVARRLGSRIPLGQRLAVQAPRYIDFRIDADIEAGEGLEQGTVEAAVRAALAARTALVPGPGGAQPRPFGVGISRRDVASWIRTTEGVRAIRSLRLMADDGAEDVIGVPPSGLPRLDLDASVIKVARRGPGAGS